MSKQITVRWEASDGYVGGSRPQSFKVDAEDFQHCETELEVEELLGEFVQDEFEQRITWSIRNESSVIAEILEAVKQLSEKP